MMEARVGGDSDCASKDKCKIIGNIPTRDLHCGHSQHTCEPNSIYH